MKQVKSKEKFVAENVRRYDHDPEFQLLAPKPMMSAKAYYERVAAPLVALLKNVIRSILMQFYEKTRELKTALDQMSKQAQLQSKQLSSYEAELIPLREIEKNYQRLRRALGENEVNRVIEKVKLLEKDQHQQMKCEEHII